MGCEGEVAGEEDSGGFGEEAVAVGGAAPAGVHGEEAGEDGAVGGEAGAEGVGVEGEAEGGEGGVGALEEEGGAGLGVGFELLFGGERGGGGNG